MTKPGYYRDTWPIEVIGRSGLHSARTTCGQCGNVETRKLGVPLQAPERIKKMFVHAGWRITTKMTCPACVTSAKNVRPPLEVLPPPIIIKPTMENVVKTPFAQQIIKPTASEIEQPVPTDDAKAIRRKVYDRIDECYDENKKRYKPAMTGGRHSDRSIAEECGCADALVAKVREEFFGPDTSMSEPEQLRAVQDDLAYLQKEATEIERTAIGLKTQAKAWQSMADEMRKKVDALCAEYGWQA